MDEVLTERITLEPGEDVLEVAREHADRAGEPLGKVISHLASHGLFASRGPGTYPDGFEPLRRSQPPERIITLEFVNRLRDGLP